MHPYGLYIVLTDRFIGNLSNDIKTNQLGLQRPSIIVSSNTVRPLVKTIKQQ